CSRTIMILPTSTLFPYTTLFRSEVAVEAARGINRESYTYSVPDGLDVVPGHRVTVPFGRRNTYGFVLSLGTEDPGVETKPIASRSEEHTSELQSRSDLVCRLLLE